MAFELNTGAFIPAVGLGTWQSAPGQVREAVAYALKTGYNHIDCAFCYGNEDEVGEGIRDALRAGKRREQIFVTTKLWCTFSSRVEDGLGLSLKSLGLDYVDLFLVHWPVAMNPNGNDIRFPKRPDGSRDLVPSWSHTQTWRQMEKLLQTGKVRAIGVCNYSVKYLEELLREAEIKPAVNQIENHPYLPQDDIVKFCGRHDIHVTAYSPLGSTGSPLGKDPIVQSIAEKHNIPFSTVLLSYHTARNSSVLAKSTTPERIDQNQTLITLDDADMAALRGISEKNGVTRYVYPAFGIDFGFPDKQ